MQQCCDYTGVCTGHEAKTAGRTFPLDTATIGYAYIKQAVVRTKTDAVTGALQIEMEQAHLTANAREMSSQVESVLAIPILGASSSTKRTVVAVLYLDSDVPGFFGDDDRVRRIAGICAEALGAVHSELARMGALSNVAYPGVEPPVADPAMSYAYDTLEAVENVPPPQVPLRRLNLDQTAFLEPEGQM